MVHPNDPLLSISEVNFSFDSFDWLIMDGVLCKHGYKQCKDTSDFACDGEINYRIGVCAFQIDDLSRLREYFPEYFWNGKAWGKQKEFKK